MPILFLTSQAITNPVRIRFAQSTEVPNLRLLGYSFSGVPVTSSVPNSLYYNLTFDGLSTLQDTQWIRNDNNPGIALALEGEFTHHDLNQPFIISKEPIRLQDFFIKLTDSDGAVATFSKCVFWFEYGF